MRYVFASVCLRTEFYSSLICYFINGKISAAIHCKEYSSHVAQRGCWLSHSFILLRKSGKNNKRKGVYVRKRVYAVKYEAGMRRRVIFRQHFYTKRKRCIFKNTCAHIYVDRFISQEGAHRACRISASKAIVNGGIFQLMFVQRPIFNMEILRYFTCENNETTL